MNSPRVRQVAVPCQYTFLGVSIHLRSLFFVPRATPPHPPRALHFATTSLHPAPPEVSLDACSCRVPRLLRLFRDSGAAPCATLNVPRVKSDEPTPVDRHVNSRTTAGPCLRCGVPSVCLRWRAWQRGDVAFPRIILALEASVFECVRTLLASTATN